MKLNLIGNLINSHKYPDIFRDWPIFLKAFQGLVHLITLRNWYVSKSLTRLIEKRNDNFVFYDAGCGSGDFLIRLAEKYKKGKFFGVDLIAENISTLQCYIEKKEIWNVKCKIGNISEYKLNEKADFILVNTVLQLVENDKQTIDQLKTQLKEDGFLIIYVPLKPSRFFPFYNKTVNKFFIKENYSSHQANKAQYSSQEIINIIESSGLQVTHKKFSYGTFGKIYYEIYNFLLLLMKKNLLLLPITFFIILMISPVLFSFMIIDFYSNIQDGNGFLLVAKK